MKNKPAYINLYESGTLDQIIERLYKVLESCELCPRKCKVNRIKGEQGFCRSGKDLIISSFGPHLGEEPELVGKSGSGTIFLANCNLGCIYCQNYDISHFGEGEKRSCVQLAGQMIYLKNIGCHNINFVTPTHFMPQIVEAVKLAVALGLDLPLVYNSSGYDNVEMIKIAEGVFDIYMPDIKYSDSNYAEKYSQAPDYFDRAKEAVKEMHRQVGDLKVEEGIAARGLLIRHLVLPNNAAGSEKVLEFIAKDISSDSYVNIMDQYRPCYKAGSFEEISRFPKKEELDKAVAIAKSLGLHRGF